jgi:hypothetical protein
LIIRHLIVPLAVTVLTISVGQAAAQGAFPAPLPGQQIQTNDPAFPPVNGAPSAGVGASPSSPFPSAGAPAFGGGGGGGGFQRPMSAAPPQGGPSDACMKNFVPLREEAEKRGKMIKAASDRHAPPDEACKLISNFGEAEVKMIKYVEAHASSCGIPAQVTDQLKNGHKGTEQLRQKVCNVAQQMQQRGPAGPTLSDVLGSSAALPEANASKKGGSAFDTLTGNVLAR